ncbi:MAG: hypothetical protein OXE59_00905 [Bacteroidetes bacterium]|nr:hypothetical protein [Bacteroidota bacterium]
MFKCVKSFGFVLFVHLLTVDCIAQIQFEGDTTGWKVNGEIINPINIPEELPDFTGDLSFQANIENRNSFPVPVKINDIAYLLWRDRLVESCQSSPTEIILHYNPPRETLSLGPGRFRLGKERSANQRDPSFMIYSFKGASNQTDVYVSYGIFLDPNGDVSGEIRSLNTRFMSTQIDINPLHFQSVDSLTALSVITFPDHHMRVGTQRIQVPSGMYDFMIESHSDRPQSTSISNSEITLPIYDQPGIQLSDVLLAHSIEEIEPDRTLSPYEIIRNGLSIMPASRNEFFNESPMYLYFEIYGLTLDAMETTDYEVEIKLDPKMSGSSFRRFTRRIFSKKKRGTSISYRESGPKSEASLYQIVDVSQQKTGVYTLTLVVRDLRTGQNSKRKQDIELYSWNCYTWS